MSQSVKELIRQIREEGFEASQQKALEIEAAAREAAAQLIVEAQASAERIVAEAEAERDKTEQATRASLQQAARNTLISLRRQLNAELTRIIRTEIRASLGADQLAGLIAKLVMEYTLRNGGAGTVEIVMDEENRRLLQESLLAKLQQSLKGGITIRSADDVGGGFAISFDAAKSWFDFSEEALARHLGKYVNEYVADLLKQT